MIKSGIEDDIVNSNIDINEQEHMKYFCYGQLKKPQIRDDYKVLIELTLIFLGEKQFGFRLPSQTSHARWMSKAIYSLKMFIFRDQILDNSFKKSTNKFRDMCIFLVKLYIEPWFETTNAIKAPLQDLKFINSAIGYATTNSKVAKVILGKMSKHLWYLAPYNVALGLLDYDVPIDVKRKMLKNFSLKEPILKLKDDRSFSNMSQLQNCDLSDFVSEKTQQFIEKFGLSSNFLKLDPSVWETSFSFDESWTFARDLCVAERGVKFMKDYNKILTNDEEEKQKILQLVEAYHKKYPSNKKSDLIH